MYIDGMSIEYLKVFYITYYGYLRRLKMDWQLFLNKLIHISHVFLDGIWRFAFYAKQILYLSGWLLYAFNTGMTLVISPNHSTYM